jgi:hypothetical protein
MMNILSARTKSSVEQPVATGKLETYHLLLSVRG